MYNEIISANVLGVPAKIYTKDEEGLYKGEMCDFHIHDEAELLFVFSGKMRFSFGSGYVDVKEGEGIFVNRRVPHRSESVEDDTKTLLLQINIEKLLKMEYNHMNKYLSLIFSGSEREYFFFDKDAAETAEIYGYMERIESEFKNAQNSYVTYIRGELFLLLGALYRHKILNNIDIKYDSEGINKIYKALVFVDKNYMNQIRLDEISGVVNMNSSYFCRLFKSVTGKTLMEYINYVRIWKSENLLTSTDESVLDISVETGFSSVSYFNRVFKKLKGTSPAVYRKIKYLK